MPWTPKQHRLFEAAAHNAAVAKRVGISQSRAGEMAAEGIKKPMNPVMHTHSSMENDVEKMPSHLRKSEIPATKGKAALGKHKGGGPFRMPNEQGHHASFRHEADEAGTEGLDDNLGSKRKSGYGEPQGGTTTIPEMGGPSEALQDETRGTHELPAHQYSASHSVAQEHKERIARALLRARR